MSNRYSLLDRGFITHYGYNCWVILEDGVPKFGLMTDKASAQKRVDFYNDNNLTHEEYVTLMLGDYDFSTEDHQVILKRHINEKM